ncbi:MAG: DNA recombination protein RmuC [Gammaproteobacteria bacterium]
MEWISFFAAFAAFAAASGFVLWKNESAARKKAETECAELRDKYETARRDGAAAVSRAEAGTQNAESLRAENESLRGDKTKSAARISELEAELRNARRGAEEKIALLENVRENMTAEFRNLSQGILEEKGKKFGEEHAKLISPLREELKQFRERTESIRTEDAADRSALKQQIESLQSNAAEYGKSADNLARALKGDSRTQGDWGEVTLANLLENSGLREGEEYETQKTLRDEDGNLLRPDVVVKLPGGKHLIVDSKVSLRDYHDSVSAEKDSAAERDALSRHLAAVKKHVAGLSGKHYARLKGVDAPDFVFMFMAVEPAFFAALRADAHLFSEAFDKKIILCAPTTLMATLRTVERIWQLERQSRNAEEMVRQVENFYDKLVNFKESLDDIGAALERASASHRTAEKQLGSGSGNLIGRANKLIELGANPKKKKLTEK